MQLLFQQHIRQHLNRLHASHAGEDNLHPLAHLRRSTGTQLRASIRGQTLIDHDCLRQIFIRSLQRL